MIINKQNKTHPIFSNIKNINLHFFSSSRYQNDIFYKYFCLYAKVKYVLCLSPLTPESTPTDIEKRQTEKYKHLSLF